MSKIFTFIVENQEIQRHLDFDQLNRLPRNIRDLLFQKEKYIVESDVKTQIFNNFIDNFIDSSTNLNVDAENIYQYRLLSDEFNFLKDELTNSEYENAFKISILLNIQKAKNFDRTAIENYISQNLDFYLQNYANYMPEIPITSLYNIFYNKNRVLNDHEKAYQFIVSNNDQNLFILIKSLDSTKLSESTLNESISKQDDHFGFIPSNSFSFKQDQVETLKKEKDELKKQVSDNEKMIFQLIQQNQLKISKGGRSYKPWFPTDVLFIVDGLNKDLFSRSIDAVCDAIFNLRITHRKVKTIRYGLIVDLDLTTNPKIFPFSNNFDLEQVCIDLGINFEEEENDDEDDFNVARSVVTRSCYSKLFKWAINNFDWKEDSSKFIFFISSSCSLDSDELQNCANELAKNDYYLLCYYFNENAKEEFIKMEELYKNLSKTSFFDLNEIIDEIVENKLGYLSSITYVRPIGHVDYSIE